MNIEDLRNFCISLQGVTEKTPFGRFAARYDSILVFYVLDHMFCFFDIDDFTSVNLRSTPAEIEELRLTRNAVGNPLNRSLKHWIKIDFNKDIPDSLIYSLIKQSYDIVREQYSKKKCSKKTRPIV